MRTILIFGQWKICSCSIWYRLWGYRMKPVVKPYIDGVWWAGGVPRTRGYNASPISHYLWSPGILYSDPWGWWALAVLTDILAHQDQQNPGSKSSDLSPPYPDWGARAGHLGINLWDAVPTPTRSPCIRWVTQTENSYTLLSSDLAPINETQCPEKIF